MATEQVWNTAYSGEIKACNPDGTFTVQYEVRLISAPFSAPHLFAPWQTGLFKTDVYPEMIQSGEMELGSTVQLTVRKLALEACSSHPTAACCRKTVPVPSKPTTTSRRPTNLGSNTAPTRPKNLPITHAVPPL